MAKRKTEQTAEELAAALVDEQQGETQQELPPSEAGSNTLARLEAMLGQLVQLQMMQMQAGQGTNNQHSEVMEKLTAAIAGMSLSSIEAVKMNIAAQRQLHRPSNEIVPKRSVFNPRGENLSDYTKPVLCCTMYIPEIGDDACLTREEVELLNLLTRVPGHYVITRIDDTKVKLTVKTERAMDEVTPSKLMILHETAYNNEYFRLMPSKHSMLRQILGQVSDNAIVYGMNRQDRVQISGAEIRRMAREILTMDAEQALIDAGKLTVAA